MSGRPKQFLARLRSLFHREQLDRDLSDELAFHVAQRTDKNRSGGMSDRGSASRCPSPTRQHNANQGAHNPHTNIRRV